MNHCHPTTNLNTLVIDNHNRVYHIKIIEPLPSYYPFQYTQSGQPQSRILRRNHYVLAILLHIPLNSMWITTIPYFAPMLMNPCLPIAYSVKLNTDHHNYVFRTNVNEPSSSYCPFQCNQYGSPQPRILRRNHYAIAFGFDLD